MAASGPAGATISNRRMHMPSTLNRDLKISPGVIGSLSPGTIERNPAERRQYARYPFTGTVEAFEPESQTRIQGRTADLSEGGCYVDSMSPFAAQTRVKVRITREKRSFESQATVVYSGQATGQEWHSDLQLDENTLSFRKCQLDRNGQ